MFVLEMAVAMVWRIWQNIDPCQCPRWWPLDATPWIG